MTSSFDAIVVGPRWAGSPTAMLLARKGYRMLFVDRATFPRAYAFRNRASATVGRVQELRRLGSFNVPSCQCVPIARGHRQWGRRSAMSPTRPPPPAPTDAAAASACVV